MKNMQKNQRIIADKINKLEKNSAQQKEENIKANNSKLILIEN